jgi:hypothetical protein
MQRSLRYRLVAFLELDHWFSRLLPAVLHIDALILDPLANLGER